uniref:NodB homology domain-containing protein n=1 Tax=uncultured Thiotrichaceae bacterium TaxID=298394 RepID=A0A6S6UGC9_9GAMM|nr:MAG: Unknown protein [uncultured Thiotrichaceae bacterium]
MNWPLIAVMLLVFMIALIVAITAIFFIRHWANRAPANSPHPTNNEGNFFIRYTPATAQPQAIEHQRKIRPPKNLRKATQHILSISVILGFLSTLGTATYINRDKLASPIDLNEQDLAALTQHKYHWKQTDSQLLPDLDAYIYQLHINNQGLLLINPSPKAAWPKNTGNLTQQAQFHWETFAEQHRLPVEYCQWSSIQKCRGENKDWINILLPGLWDQASTQELLQQGAKIIAYGPPLQTYIEKNTPFEFLGLTFKHGYATGKTDLSLVGDKELTLGFDAGMILELESDFTNYQVHSESPQGISISRQHVAGGDSHTRLFARSFENKGRLVWLDFSPNEDAHQRQTPYYLHSLTASLLRYLKAEPYSGWANWPNGKSFAALLEQDTEDQFDNARYVAEYFQEKNYPITWYALSNEAQKSRQLTRLLAETGEIACHGDNHMDFPLQTLELQTHRIARCRKVMKELTGQPVVSFRPPREEYNTDTFHAMGNNGIRHFIAEVSGDRFTPIIYSHSTDEMALVSIPRMNSDDYLLWGDVRLSGKDSIAQLRQEMDWIKNIGGIFMFSFHSQFMNNTKNLQTVKDLADHIHNNQAFFATTSDIANWWRLRTQLQNNETPDSVLIKKFHPVLLTTNSEGKLQQKIIQTSTEVSMIQTKEIP